MPLQWWGLMAIIIPSKNIYNKENQKVRDNVIERIEVGAVEISDAKDNNANVYNDTFIIDTTYVENNGSNYYWEAPTVIYGSSIVSTFAYVEYNNHTYANIDIKIPLLQQSSWIKELNLGKDKDNNPNIQYSIGGYVNKGTVSSTNWYGTIEKEGNKAFISMLTKAHLSYNQTGKGDYQTYQIPKESTSSFIGYDVVSSSASAKVNVVDGGNLITVKPDIITENGIEYYKLSLKILVGCRIVKITSYNSVPEDYTAVPFPITKEGYNIGDATYEEYVPSEINLTVYGKKIGIDLTDKTVYIPETDKTSKKVHSIDGNELMQTSNYYETFVNPIEVQMGGELSSDIDFSKFELYSSKNLIVGQLLYYENEKAEIVELPEGTGDPYKIKVKTNGQWASASGWTITVYSKKVSNSIDKNYQQLINSYKNGKETATIRCSISNYKMELNAKVVRYDIHEDNTIYCILDVFNSEIAHNLVDYYIYSNGVKGYVADYDETTIFVTFYGIVKDIESGEIKIEFYPIAIDGTTSMCFSIGDEVIPMVYGSDGQDHPMSIYVDGTAKVFRVLGTKIYYDGAVWQELSLQEV